MTAQLATARPHFHVDTNVGDPISPAQKNVCLPRLLGGEIVLRGYPLAMVHAEKIVTAVARGTVNTRWRDFADICLLARHHAIAGTELIRSTRHVAEHRQVQLVPLAQALLDYGQIGQQEMDGVAPPATAGGPTAGVLQRHRRRCHRLRRSRNHWLRQRPLMGSDHPEVAVTAAWERRLELSQNSPSTSVF
jgi:hypothetical protein